MDDNQLPAMNHKEQESRITFNLTDQEGPREVIRLSKDGFYYNNEFIDDAGEAHRLFVEFFYESKKISLETDCKELCIEILKLLDYYIPEDKERPTVWDDWRNRARAILPQQVFAVDSPADK
jgi:hypothetical protein